MSEPSSRRVSSLQIFAAMAVAFVTVTFGVLAVDRPDAPPRSAATAANAAAAETANAASAEGNAGTAPVEAVDRCGATLSTLPNQREHTEGNEVSEVAFNAPASAQQQQAASDFAQSATENTERFPTSEAARAAGYTMSELDSIRATLPEDASETFELGLRAGTIDHWFNPELANDGIAADPAKPDALMYATDGDRYVLAGFLYLAPTCEHGPQFGGALTVWHSHDPLGCYEDTAPVGLPSGYEYGKPWAEQRNLRCARGELLNASPEMLHVWLGADSLEATFSSTMSPSWALANLG